MRERPWPKPSRSRRAASVSEVPIRAARRDGGSGHSYGSLIAIAADYWLLSARRPFLVSGALSGLASLGGVALMVFGAASSSAGLALGAARYGVADEVLPIAVCNDASYFEGAIDRMVGEARGIADEAKALAEHHEKCLRTKEHLFCSSDNRCKEHK